MKLRSHLLRPITRTVRATRLGGLAWLHSYSSFAWELRTDSFALVNSSSVSIPPARSAASPSISRSSVDGAGGGGRTGVAGKILSHPWHDCGISQNGRSHAHCGPWTVSTSHAWVPTSSSYSNCTNSVRIRSAAVTSLRNSTRQQTGAGRAPRRPPPRRSGGSASRRPRRARPPRGAARIAPRPPRAASPGAAARRDARGALCDGRKGPLVFHTMLFQERL